MPDPNINLNEQCNRCLSKLVEASNRINSIQRTVENPDVDSVYQQFDYLEMAINRLYATLANLDIDDIPY